MPIRVGSASWLPGTFLAMLGGSTPIPVKGWKKKLYGSGPMRRGGPDRGPLTGESPQMTATRKKEVGEAGGNGGAGSYSKQPTANV